MDHASFVREVIWFPLKKYARTKDLHICQPLNTSFVPHLFYKNKLLLSDFTLSLCRLRNKVKDFLM
jgi:hypothetical protein